MSHSGPAPSSTTGRELSRLDNQVLSLFASDLATATVTAYRSGLRRFIIFYNQYHHNPFPLDGVTLCRFVAHLDAGNLTTQTIRLYLSALRFYQIAQGGPLTQYPRLHYILQVGARLTHSTEAVRCRFCKTCIPSGKQH